MESNYPESWSRQTPKGYEPLSINKEVCNCTCNCKNSVNELLENQEYFEE